MNKIIKEYRKQTGTETGPDGVVRPRTRSFTDFTCSYCGTHCTVQTSHFSKDKPCTQCQKRLRGKNNFLRRAKDKFGSQFDLTQAEAEYYDSTTPVTIHCNIHNVDFKVSPTNFVKTPRPNQPAKGGCPECRSETAHSKNKKSIDHYLAILSDKFPNIEVVSHGTAETNLEAIELSCNEHGSFTKTLASIISSDPTVTNLCPKCSYEQHAWRTRMARTDIPGIVYFVKFKAESIYKCGVTYKTVNARLRGHTHNIEKMWTLDFTTLSDAYFFEYQFFREFKSLKCKHPDTSLGGYTEFFTQFISKPDKRFVEEILRRKESNSGDVPPVLTEDNPERSPL